MLTSSEAKKLIEIADAWNKENRARSLYSFSYNDLVVAINELTEVETKTETSKHSKCECSECGSKGQLYIHGKCHIESPLEAIVDGDKVTIKCFTCKKPIVKFEIGKVITSGL